MFPVFSWYADYVDEVSKPWVIPNPDPREVTFGKYTVHYAYSYYGQVKFMLWVLGSANSWGLPTIIYSAAT